MTSPSKPIASIGSTATPSRSPSPRIRNGLRRPPPQTSQRVGGSANASQRRRGRFDVKARERRRAVGVAERLDRPGRGGEMVAVERLRRVAVEIGIAHQRVDEFARRRGRSPASAPSSSRASRAGAREIVDQRVGRPGVEGDDLARRAEIGDVADPAPVENHQRTLECRRPSPHDRSARAARLRRRPRHRPSGSRRRRRFRAPRPRARRRRAGGSGARAADAGSSGRAGRQARRSSRSTAKRSRKASTAATCASVTAALELAQRLFRFASGRRRRRAAPARRARG